MEHFKEWSAEDFMRSIFNDTYVLFFSDFLYKSVYKSIGIENSLELLHLPNFGKIF